MQEKKPVGKIHRSLSVKASGITILNGEECIRYSDVPVILLEYSPDEKDKTTEEFKLWCQLHQAENIVKEPQYRKNLHEMSIWFEKPEEIRIKEWLKNE
jgi:hypothetical protein